MARKKSSKPAKRASSKKTTTRRAKSATKKNANDWFLAWFEEDKPRKKATKSTKAKTSRRKLSAKKR